MNKIYFLIFLLNSLLLSAQTTWTISDPEDLSDLELTAGDVVILENGTYSSDERIKFFGTGTAQNPITFRPETPGGVIFDNGLQMNIAGDYLVVDGFYWNGGFGASNFIQFRDSTTYAQHSTIQNCAINGLTVNPDDIEVGTSVKHKWVVLYGNYNTVTNCTFMNKTNAGALVLVELEFNAEEDRCKEVGHTISNNYFFNFEKIDTSLTNAGDSETIRVGTSEFQNVNCGTTVSNNYFVSADGENEIISNKSDNNIYTNNTFRRSRGSLVLRHGSGATVDSNYFLGENIDGTGGIRIADSDHVITNNYVQDCITVVSQAIWNNGITFMGGNTSSVDDCASTSVTNGYQYVEDILVSNNTFVNTNAPLFYNIDRGTRDLTGTVSNNLIYFEESSNNVSNVISGDETNSYSSIGETLTYTGNVYDGANLGETVDGFLESSITTTANGEIFELSGANGIGADLGSFEPHVDANVGNGVGACFLDFQGGTISNPTCTIEEIDTISINNLAAFTAQIGQEITTITANVPWTATVNDTWISIDTDSGEGSTDITVSVLENNTFESRTGSVIFSQVGGSITRTLFVMQDGLEITDAFSLINTGGVEDPVMVVDFSDQQITDTKSNLAINTLDKDFGTQWTADDGVSGVDESETDGEFIIYDLGNNYDLDLIEIATDSKDNSYGFQVWISSTGMEEADFAPLLPESGDFLLSAINFTEFNQYFLEQDNEARYVKVIGFGRFKDGIRTSVWSTITEINFYGESTTLSNEDFTAAEDLGIIFYPNPVEQQLNIISPTENFEFIKIYNIMGGVVYEQVFNTSVNVNILSTGVYFIELSNSEQSVVKRILVE